MCAMSTITLVLARGSRKTSWRACHYFLGILTLPTGGLPHMCTEPRLTSANIFSPRAVNEIGHETAPENASYDQTSVAQTRSAHEAEKSARPDSVVWPAGSLNAAKLTTARTCHRSHRLDRPIETQVHGTGSRQSAGCCRHS